MACPSAVWCAALAACWLALGSGNARAYSSYPDYTRAVHEGGGGGRLFTGSPADGYGCAVCHRGAQGAPLDVLGLPEEGYVPGQQYEITLRWPADTPHAALMAEITDARGAPAGVTALAPFATWQIGERCENDTPAADVCRRGGGGDGCCAAARDACSFPGERAVLWVADCGSRFARMIWTAPDASAGEVWFSSEMVNSDVKNDSLGDGVTSVRRRIAPRGLASDVTVAVGDCRATRARASGVLPLSGVIVAALVLCIRRRSTG